MTNDKILFFSINYALPTALYDIINNVKLPHVEIGSHSQVIKSSRIQASEESLACKSCNANESRNFN